MDLRNNRITLGEVLKHPGAREVLKEELPGLYGTPLMRMARSMPLKKVLEFSKGRISAEKVNRILERLRAV